MNAEKKIDLVEDERLKVSALVDGELDAATIERTIDALLASEELACFWADAHRAGDWLRSEEVIGVGHGEVFLRRISAELANEPTVLAPAAGASASEAQSRRRRFWIRTGLPGASVAAALVVVAWVAIPNARNDAAGGKLAAAEPTVALVPVASGDPAAPGRQWKAVDPERLSDYLAAHRDVTPFRSRGGPSAVTASYSPSTDASPSR